MRGICGECGTEFNLFAEEGRTPRRFCSVKCRGINTNNRPEIAQKKREKMKQKWESAGFVRRVKIAVSDVELRERNSQRLKKLWRDENYREEMSAVSRKTWSNPEFRAFMSKLISELRNGEGKDEWNMAIRESWNDEKRAKLTETLKAVWAEKLSDPEVLAEYSRKMSGRWDDDGFRKKVTAGIKRAANMPEAKKKRSEASLAMWRNPEMAEKLLMSAWERLSAGKKTSIEIMMEKHLAELGLSPKYNHRVGHKFIDLALIDKMIGVECDGKFWHHGREKEDAKRDEYLKSRGWTIVHFGEDEIRHNLADAVSLKLLPLLEN